MPEYDTDASDKDSAPRNAGLANMVVDTLFALTEQPGGLSVRAIAQSTDNSRSSAHRILQALSKGGYVRQSDNGSYVVGPQLLLMAARTFGAVPVLQIINDTMHELVDEVNETSYFAIFSHEDQFTTYFRRIESTHPVRHVQPLGVRIPLHAGAVGKAILSRLQDFDLSKLVLEAYTPNTKVTVETLRADIDTALSKGYATSIEERISGVGGVAAPVMSGDQLIGALTISVPKSRIPDGRLDEIGERVKTHAEALSSTLTSLGIRNI